MPFFNTQCHRLVTHVVTPQGSRQDVPRNL
jgi:hypothetical protein